MPPEATRPKREGRHGVWARVLEDLLGIILTEIEEASPDRLFGRALRKAAPYFILFILAGSCFVFLNVGAVLWVRNLVMDGWVAFLAIALFYALLILVFLLVRFWREPSEGSIKDGIGQKGESPFYRYKKGISNREILRREWALPLALVALCIGFLAAPGRKSSSAASKNSISVGGEIIARFLGNVANRIADHVLDSYFPPGDRKSSNDRVRGNVPP